MEMRIPKGFDLDASTSWCPGCGHGIVMRILQESLEELGVGDKLIMVEDVACGHYDIALMKSNFLCCAHGRPIIAAAGVKRVRPDAIVVAHPGDGAAYSIGIESTIHCAARNENILALVINNSVYGMTGGQMSPASLPGQKTTSSPRGRDVELDGHPLDIMKTLSSFEIAYLARGSVSSVANINKTKKMMKKAIQKQINGEGFCLLEVLSACPTNWNKSPVDALEFMKEAQEKYFQTGEFVDKGGK